MLVMHESVARSQFPSRLYTKSGVELESFILRNKVYSQSRNCTPDDNVMCLLNAATDLLYVVLWSSELREIAYCLWVSSILHYRSIESHFYDPLWGEVVGPGLRTNQAPQKRKFKLKNIIWLRSERRSPKLSLCVKNEQNSKTDRHLNFNNDQNLF